MTALDGLRGLAALVVVVHHSLLAVEPALAAPYQNSHFHLRTGSLDWWVSDTPLHIFWAGPEAVMVFFVLSGYVLTLPAVKDGTGWFAISYYPRRLVRLYLPVWGALVFAGVLHVMYTRTPIPGASWFLNSHPSALTVKATAKTATLLAGQSSMSQYTSVLWSLKYEVAFSVLLPLLVPVVLYTRRRPRVAALLAAALFAVTWFGATRASGPIQYMPVFVIGALFALYAERLDLTLRGTARTLVITAAAIASICLLTMTYWIDHQGVTASRGPEEMGTVLGACVVMWLAVHSHAFGRLLDSRPGQWAGSRSYSLYLVHEPIVVTLAFVLGGRPELVGFLTLVVPLSLLAAELFWRFVERPSIAAARRAGHIVSGLVTRRSPGYQPTS